MYLKPNILKDCSHETSNYNGNRAVKLGVYKNIVVSNTMFHRGHAVHFVEAQCYTPESRGFDFR